MPYDNTNRGVLFRETEKVSPNAPDYRGTINLDGKDANLAGWIKTSSKDGKKYLSLQVDTKFAKQHKKEEPKAEPAPEEKTNQQVLDELDDIPFNEDR